MKEIIEFAQTVSPLGVIAILAIIIFQLVDGKGLMKKIRGTQVDRTVNEAITLISLNSKIDKIANNHLHELPDMKKSIDRIEQKMDSMIEKSSSHGERISKLEGVLDK